MNTNNICIFPGTFNPIHNGHIKMANFALKNYKFDKIIFIPAYLPPHKEISNILAGHRMSMVKLATLFNKKFEVSDIEYNSNNTSYSIITVKKIKELYNIKDRINFIIGTDAFAKINTWYQAEELKNLVHFIVFPRKGDEIENISKQLKNDNWDFEIAKMEYVDISSTEIRNGNSSNINKKIKDYIKENELYRN